MKLRGKVTEVKNEKLKVRNRRGVQHLEARGTAGIKQEHKMSAQSSKNLRQ